MRKLTTVLILISIAAVPVQGALSSCASRALYERIKSLAGTWEGKSTKGWVEKTNIQVIAEDRP